ncbi:MAG: peptidoglycan DD-metalloendopeptidase family protein [Sedimentibacter sp.]|uniref:M23 family metallopeptidase n=1 Tax=Sedimentibacter sp. TaxID=1960295 RepID=UPI0031597BAB
MKKITLILLLSVLLAAGCRYSISSITQIEAVNTMNGEKTVISKDSDDAKQVIDALNKIDKVDRDTSKMFPYQINVVTSRGDDFYTLYFDTENKAAYVQKGEKVYKVRDKEARSLFLNQIFSYVYVDDTIYDAGLKVNGEEKVAEIRYDWTYKDIDGHYVKKEGLLQTSDEREKAVSLADGDVVELWLEEKPDSQVTRIYKDGTLVAAGNSINDVLAKAVSDGEYYVECQSQWLMKTGSESFGSQTVSFFAQVDRPVGLSVVTKENYPGNILLLYIDNLNEGETVDISTKAVKTGTETYVYKDRTICILPIDINASAQDYDITAVINKGKNNEYTVGGKFTVKGKSFKTQYLTVSEEMNQTNNDNAAILEFAELVKPARSVSSNEKLWEGTFLMPVAGELTTDFAEIRYVNNEMSSSRHSGLDLAADKGTPVAAPNSGIVVFAMEGLLSPGNTVVIDHGMGLFTSYYHLDTIEVEKGQKVVKGDIIGTVGTTGFSTGPHLHYAVSIYNTYVNPYQTLSGIID